MKRVISISLHCRKCWKITTSYLKYARGMFSPLRPERIQPPFGEYDRYAFNIIGMYRREEEKIKRYNKFDRKEFEERMKKLIEDIKNDIIK